MTASKNEKPATPASSAKLEPAQSYEQAFSELEQIVAQMESGQMSLEDSLTAYTRGNTLLEFCQKSLADVEQQVKILNERQQLTPFNSENE
ncbi:MAG TPA: exodeoxyribonuclease VII small subunit [Methylotenera sp.]|jgi:exodeoxyribonuclease VII small subunit